MIEHKSNSIVFNLIIPDLSSNRRNVEVTTSSDDLSYFLWIWNVVYYTATFSLLQVAGNPGMSVSAFSHRNTSRCADGIHCIPAAVPPDHSAASQWIRRSFSEKQLINSKRIVI